MRLTLVSADRAAGASGNVIAEVPGRDPSLAPVLVGGHLDSWDLGTGAIDDGAGVAIATAAAKRIMDRGRPLRTIRIVWFGAEEVGLFGGLDYPGAPRQGAASRHRPKAISAPTACGGSTASSARRASAEALALGAALAPLGIVTGIVRRGRRIGYRPDDRRRPARRSR